MNIVKFILGFLLYIYTIHLSTTKKNQTNKQTSNLHTPHHTNTVIFYSTIFTAISMKFQENHGFCLQNTEKWWQQRIFNYFLIFIFWLMVCFVLCLARDFGLVVYQKDQQVSYSLIALHIQVHTCRRVKPFGNADRIVCQQAALWKKSREALILCH